MKRRRPGRPRSGILLFVVGAALLMMGQDCPGPGTNPLSNDGCNCKPPETECCVAHRKCCKPEFPHHCQETRKCYKYFTDAQAACGNNYELCGSPIGAAPIAPSDEDASAMEPRAVADGECLALFE